MKITLIAAISAAIMFTATAQAGVKDPRICSTSTAAYCASHAAGRAAVAKVKGAAATVAPVLAVCDQTGQTLLRWRCRLNDGGGHGWNVSVVYRATSTGWRVTVRVL